MKNIFFSLCLSLACMGPLVAQQTVGLFQNDPATSEGYTLLAPMPSTNTYLIDNCGREVQRWESAFTLGTVAYLLDNGSLLRTCRIPNAHFPIGGLCGRIEILDWSSNVSWHYTLSDSQFAQHHDAIMLPSGNILMVVWEVIDSAAAVAVGRNPATLGAELWPDKLVEIQPTTTGAGNIVWEWRAWDHLIQDFDAAKPNYGVVGNHPERLNLNYLDPTSKVNWMHVNGIAYNPLLDQIALSSHRWDEIWIIDHSTSTQEAASSSGGQRGKGGDLLYRYGNPQTYDRGTAADQKFFGQHNITWTPSFDRFAGQLQVFNNGNDRPAGAYSTLEIFQPPMDLAGNYLIATGQPYGPSAPTWIYEDQANFYSQLVSSFQRLPHGHSLACQGLSGTITEIDSLGNTVWKYVNPVVGAGPVQQGDSIAGNTVFRAYKYPLNYAGLNGQLLPAGDRIEGNPLPLPNACLPSASSESMPNALSQVWPNPFQSSLNIRFPDGKPRMYQLRDLQGRSLAGGVLRGTEEKLDLGNLPAGMYLLQIDGEAQAHKITKLER